MEYRKLGRTGLQVSVLGFGALEIGRDWPYWRKDKHDFSRPDVSEAIAVIHKAIDAGINFFDTAPAYQASEEVLGKALQGLRKEVLVATKCGEWFDGKNSVYDYSYAETKKFIDNSLRLLKTDYTDLLQIHSANAEIIRKGETLEAMKEARQAGKTRFLGLSTDYVDAALLAIESGEFDAIQVSYNAFNRLFATEVFSLAQKSDIGIIVKDGMARGKLSAKYADIASDDERKTIEKLKSLAEKNGLALSELAVRYVISNPAVSTVIVGTKKTEHLAANVASAERGSLPADLIDAIERLNT